MGLQSVRRCPRLLQPGRLMEVVAGEAVMVYWRGVGSGWALEMRSARALEAEEMELVNDEVNGYRSFLPRQVVMLNVCACLRERRVVMRCARSLQVGR